MNPNKTLATMVRAQMLNLMLVHDGRGDELGSNDYLELEQRALVTHDVNGVRVLTTYGQQVHEEIPA